MKYKEGCPNFSTRLYTLITAHEETPCALTLVGQQHGHVLMIRFLQQRFNQVTL